jgi:hypothetical protein
MDIDIKKLPVPKLDILNKSDKDNSKDKIKKKTKITYKYLDQLFKKDGFLKKYFE